MTLLSPLILAIVILVLIFVCLPKKPTIHAKKRVLVSLGSGGHTTEMLLMLKTIDLMDFERLYYTTSGDPLSLRHATDFETQLSRSQSTSEKLDIFAVRTIPRARRVGQSWITSVFTSLSSFASSLSLVYRDQPDLLICNGPGSCVMLVFAALFYRILRIKHCRIIFIESFARVKKLSLSGKILIHLVDRFLVMWPELAERYEKAEYVGLLI